MCVFGCMRQPARTPSAAAARSRMSGQNVDVVARLFAAYNRGDLDAVLADCDPDIEVDWTRSIGPEPSMYYEHDGLSRLAQSYGDVFEEITLTPDTFIDIGDEVVVAQVRRLWHRDGLSAEVQSVFVWTIRTGLAVRFRLFHSREEALAAV